MGCDIHTYIEYKKPTNAHWVGYGGRINPERRYGIFAKLADVRNYFSDGKVEVPYPPRGLPDDLGYAAAHDNRLYVLEDQDGKQPREGSCLRSAAERWVAQGLSIWLHADQRFVSHPDWHSHSWLTAAELRDCLSDPVLEFNEKKDPEYGAILNTLEYFEKLGYAARLVFWFDN